jgi:signal recognition particle subunit SRP54
MEAMIQSMTRGERADPYAMIREPGRVKRIARGSGQPEQGVSELIQKFLFMKQMMGSVANMGMLGRIPGMKQVAAARNMKKAMASGFPGMPGMPGMGMPGMPGMGFPGMGMPGMPGMPFGMPGAASAGPSTKMKSLSKSEKNAKKAQRRRERDARKKGRK